MLRKTKNVGIYKSGRPIGGESLHTFRHEGTTRLLPAAQGTSEAAEQIGALDAPAIKKRDLGTGSNANRLRGGQWRHIW
jgi:hypothetical protein